MRRPVSRLAGACVLVVAAALCTGTALAGNGNDNGNPNPPGQVKKDEAAATQSSAQVQSSASVQASASASTSSSAQTSAQSSAPTSQSVQDQNANPATPGVKPDNSTQDRTKCTFGGGTSTSAVCTAQANASGVQATAEAKAKTDASKRYGNGTTAAEIAVNKGVPKGSTIYGPGNSQPHKVSCPGTAHGQGGGPDVHAFKSGSSPACGTQTTTAAPSAPGKGPSSGNVSQNNVSSNVSSNAPSNVSGSAGNVSSNASTTTTASTTPASTTTPSTATTTTAPVQAVAGAHASKAPKAKHGVLGTTKSLAKPPAKSVLNETAPVRSGSLPFTGFPIWAAVFAALALVAAGLALLRHSVHSRL